MKYQKMTTLQFVSKPLFVIRIIQHSEICICLPICKNNSQASLYTFPGNMIRTSLSAQFFFYSSFWKRWDVISKTHLFERVQLMDMIKAHGNVKNKYLPLTYFLGLDFKPVTSTAISFEVNPRVFYSTICISQPVLPMYLGSFFQYVIFIETFFVIICHFWFGPSMFILLFPLDIAFQLRVPFEFLVYLLPKLYYSRSSTVLPLL